MPALGVLDSDHDSLETSHRQLSRENKENVMPERVAQYGSLSPRRRNISYGRDLQPKFRKRGILVLHPYEYLPASDIRVKVKIIQAYIRSQWVRKKNYTRGIFCEKNVELDFQKIQSIFLKYFNPFFDPRVD